jgi:HD-like signal output (HDOD) protein
MQSPAPTQPFIVSAPRDLAAWADGFDAASLPVLASTAATLEELRANEDAVDAHLLAEAIGNDPLMVLKVLAHVAALRRGREGGNIETVTEALVMLGITPFFRDFAPQTAADDVLQGQPAALAGFRKVLRRAHRAANFAIAFAVHRMDGDATVIHEAALLHDFAELLLWLRAPALARDIERLQREDAQLRSAQAQRQVLNIVLPDLQHELMQRWRLPALLVRITDQHREADVQVRNVLLAIRVARHSAQGWDNAALPDDVRDIAALLNLGTEPTLRLLQQVDDS